VVSWTGFKTVAFTTGLIVGSLSRGVSALKSSYGSLNQLVTLDGPTGCGLLPQQIWNNNNPASIDQQIVECKPFLNRTFAPYDLTLLHLAGIADNSAAIEALHREGADLDARDFQGFTPLHHEAMQGDVESVADLISRGANPKSRYNMGGTFADLLRFNRPFREQNPALVELEQSLLKGIPYSAHRVENHRVEDQCLGDSATLVYENVARPQFLVSLWKEKPGKTVILHNKLYKQQLKAFTQLINNPPPLTIRAIKIEGSGKSICGVVAERAIKRGEIIAEYTGEMIDQLGLDADRTYFWTNYPSIDSIKYRSAGSMINAGFPNIFVDDLRESGEGKGFLGIPVRKVMIAYDDIAAGQQILYDYGPNYKFKDGFTELDKPAMYEYFKKHTLMDCAMMSNDPHTEANAFVRRTSIVNKLIHVINRHPSLMVDMLAAGVIKNDDWINFQEIAPVNMLENVRDIDLEYFILSKPEILVELLVSGNLTAQKWEVLKGKEFLESTKRTLEEIERTVVEELTKKVPLETSSTAMEVAEAVVIAVSSVFLVYNWFK